jgi:hypothetical protein
MKIKPISWIQNNGCMICTSHHLDRDGYPEIMRDGRRTKLPRLVMFRRYGEQPNEIQTRHTCDTPACINPEHIIPGSHKDNSKDKSDRKRIHGTKNPRAKLTENNVRLIRENITGKYGNLVALSKRFNVSVGTISAVKQGRNWGWLV